MLLCLLGLEVLHFSALLMCLLVKLLRNSYSLSAPRWNSDLFKLQTEGVLKLGSMLNFQTIDLDPPVVALCSHSGNKDADNNVNNHVIVFDWDTATYYKNNNGRYNLFSLVPETPIRAFMPECDS